jgi:branched-chain amino acid transport system ATP-binding protein
VKAHVLSSIPAITLVRPTSQFKGITIVLIEQNAKQALQVSDYGLVPEEGQTRIEDTASQILADPQIAQLFLSGGLAPVEGMS